MLKPRKSAEAGNPLGAKSGHPDRRHSMKPNKKEASP
jgi:hypothetical protein